MYHMYYCRGVISYQRIVNGAPSRCTDAILPFHLELLLRLTNDSSTTAAPNEWAINRISGTGTVLVKTNDIFCKHWAVLFGIDLGSIPQNIGIPTKPNKRNSVIIVT